MSEGLLAWRKRSVNANLTSIHLEGIGSSNLGEDSNLSPIFDQLSLSDLYFSLGVASFILLIK